MKHTPTPWHISKTVPSPKDGPKARDTAILIAVDGKERVLAECFGRIGEDVFVDSQANAAFIVEACSSYEKHVQQIQRLDSAVRAQVLTIERLNKEREALLEASSIIATEMHAFVNGRAKAQPKELHAWALRLQKTIALCEGGAK